MSASGPAPSLSNDVTYRLYLVILATLPDRAGSASAADFGAAEVGVDRRYPRGLRSGFQLQCIRNSGTLWLDVGVTDSSGAMEVFEPVSILRSLLERGRVVRYEENKVTC